MGDDRVVTAAVGRIGTYAARTNGSTSQVGDVWSQCANGGRCRLSSFGPVLLIGRIDVSANCQAISGRWAGSFCR